MSGTFSVQNFDNFLREVTNIEGNISPREYYLPIHPKVWNGYWNIMPYPAWIRVIFKYLGRKLHNKYLYWVGLPLYWVKGLKEYTEWI